MIDSLFEYPGMHIPELTRKKEGQVMKEYPGMREISSWREDIHSPPNSKAV